MRIALEGQVAEGSPLSLGRAREAADKGQRPLMGLDDKGRCPLLSRNSMRSNWLWQIGALSLFLCVASVAGGQDLTITEFLAAGGNVTDEDGDSTDWIEIHNPGAAEVPLGGWFLTDDGFNLRKWPFPEVSIPPGAFLLVLASGKDRAQSGHELHTNFRLSSSGEFLALVRPNGIVADAYAPEYPQQFDDISFGIAQDARATVLVAEGAAARVLVPDGSDMGDWNLPGYNDSSWLPGTTGIGFDRGQGGIDPPGEPVNLAPLGTATQSSDYPDGQFPADLAIDGDLDNFTHTAAGQNLPATWELDFGSTRSIESIVLHNRRDCCRSRLRDITVSILNGPGGANIFESDLLNPENVLGAGGTGGPESIAVDVAAAAGGAVQGRVVQIVRTPDPDLSGSGGEGNPDEADVLSLAEVEVFEGIPGFQPWIGTDIGDSMQGLSASVYVRIPFEVADTGAIQTLQLRVKYDDGFISYLNGIEVARRNAPAVPAWNSTATAERPDGDAVLPEELDVSAAVSALRPGANTLAIQALNISAGDDDLLILPELVGKSIAGKEYAFFRNPTPGKPNDTAGVAGFVADTRFSRDRGFCAEPFDLEITTTTAGAEIRYTINGSPPTQESGLLYQGPIRVARTTTVRARAFKAGLEPTNIDTHTYIFVDDVMRQDSSATLAAGFPATWGGTAPDYGMDPDVVGPNDRYGGAYAATIRDDLKSIPSLSIVMKIDDMFGPNGIYTRSTSGGLAYERPASVELILPPGPDGPADGGFQVDCGIRIQGGYFRSHSATRKHSFRLLFKEEYGPAKLRYPIFGPRAGDSFDTITLRAGANDGYSWDAARLTEQYIRDQFGRSLQRATGNAGAPGTFVHLYINGIYWGLYNPVERPDHSFSARIHGGEKEEWDAVHDGATTNGNLSAWNAMISQATAARTSLNEYLKLQGMNPDGSRNPAFPHLLDVPNYADYLIVNLWGGNWDWPWKNWWAGRSQAPDSTGFKFYCWDFENTIGNNRDRSPLTKNALQNDFSGAGRAHQLLASNPEYKLLFADRVHRFFFGGGILSPAALVARYAPIADSVERAIVGESARWGDQHFNPPLTLTEWISERNWILGTYLPQRSAIVLAQFRSAGLYPAVEAPTFSRAAGLVEPGSPVVASAPDGIVYYTIDGSDPRLPGGSVSPEAESNGQVEPLVLVPPGATVRAFVPSDDSIGQTWTGPAFDDSAWISGPTGIGFEGGTGYETLIQTSVMAQMQGKSSTIYLRIPFDVDGSLFEGGKTTLALVVLKMKYDDGYVAYLNGSRVAARNAPDPPAWNSRASISHADSAAVVFEGATLAGATDLLRPGRNVLAIQGLNSSPASDDFLILPQLEAAPGSAGIPIAATTVVKARALVGQTWSALNEATFIVDTPLRITEVMYHPAPADDGAWEDADFEFVELQNIGQDPLDLSQLNLEGGIEFDFATSAVKTLGARKVMVVVKNIEAFASRYNASRILVAGEYRGRLDNLGEFLVLRGPAGEAILDFDYEDDWYPETDGLGKSLVIADARQSPSSWSLASSWQPSQFPFGSPGIDESEPQPTGGWQFVGDLNQDAQLNISDPISVLLLLFLGGQRPLPCEGATARDGGNLPLLDANGDKSVDLSDPVYILNYLFLGGPPPALGAACVLVEGCPDRCN